MATASPAPKYPAAGGGGGYAMGAVPPPPPPPPRMSAALPPGWQEVVDPSSGAHYYYNANTQATQWERPAALDAAPSARARRAEADANLAPTMVLLAINPIGEPAKQRALGVPGVEMDQPFEERMRFSSEMAPMVLAAQSPVLRQRSNPVRARA